MAPSSKKLVLLFLALSLMIAAVHGCAPDCPTRAPPPPLSSSGGTCPIDTLKLSVCADVLGLLKLNLPVPPNEGCCPLLAGLVDLEAAVCLCTAIRANILGVINLNVLVDPGTELLHRHWCQLTPVLRPCVDLVLLLNQCHKNCPPGFTCPV